MNLKAIGTACTIVGLTILAARIISRFVELPIDRDWSAVLMIGFIVLGIWLRRQGGNKERTNAR